MPSRPNVIVILSDSFRADFIGAYGNDWVKTPNLDELAGRSAVFTRAYAEFPITVPSRTAFVTGNYTFTNRPWIPLQPSDVSIAEIAAQNGYRTVAFSDSPFSPGANMNKGFVEFNWLPGGKVRPAIEPDSEPWPDEVEWVEGSTEEERDIYLRTARNRAYYMDKHGEYFPEYLVHQAAEWAQDAPKESVFLWVDIFDPHEPWDSPSPYREMYDPDTNSPRMALPTGGDASFLTPDRRRRLLAQYAGCCTQTDAAIGELLAELDSAGLLENSILIFASDHGEPFGEHGVVRKFGGLVYEELARIPLMVCAPGCRTGNIDALAQNVDLAPTLCSLLGWEHGPMQGEDLSPILKGEKDAVRTRAWVGAFGMRSGVLTERHKYIDNRGEKENELYDLSADPGETNNLLTVEPEIARGLAYELWEFCGAWAVPFTWRNGPRDVHEMSRGGGGRPARCEVV